MSEDIRRMYSMRDDLADAAEEIYGVDCSDRGYDAVADAGEFVIRLPDGTAWEVRVSQS